MFAQLASLLAASLLLSACSLESEDASGQASGSSSPTAAPSPTRSSQDRAAGEPEACGEVRAGIDAFNLEDYEETVRRFKAALPIAEAAAAAAPTPKTRQLAEAIGYYAALPAEGYRDAFENSAEFSRWQVVTLGQCTSPEDPVATPTPLAEA